MSEIDTIIIDNIAPVLQVQIGVQGPAGPPGPPGVGSVPAGGLTSQLLHKLSDADSDVEWFTIAKTDVGLGSADNTSDVDKPVSTAQAAADAAIHNVASYSLGVATAPGITYASPNVILDDTGAYYAYANADYSGPLVAIAPAGATLECTTEETTYYIYAYNNGTGGALGITSNQALLHDGRYVAISSVIRTGIYFHTTSHDQLALGHVSKIQRVMEHTIGYRRMDGLEISVVGVRNLSVLSGTVALGGIMNTLSAIDSSVGDNLFLTYWNGAWVRTNTTQLNNSQYQAVSNLATLSNNYYVVNWIWRGVETQKHIYFLLGGQYKTQAEAEQSGPPNPPDWIDSHAYFAGRVIFKQGVDAPVLVQNVQDLGYVFTGAVYHNDTADKQGDGPEYYHLNAAQFAGAVAHATGPAAVEINFAFGDATPSAITTALAGKLIQDVQVHIRIPFDGAGASLMVGDAGQTDRLMVAAENDPYTVGANTSHPSYAYAVDTAIVLSITPGAGATQGAGVLVIHFQY